MKVTKETLALGYKVQVAPYTMVEFSIIREIEIGENDSVAEVEEQQYAEMRQFVLSRIAPIAKKKAESLTAQLDSVEMPKSQRQRFEADLSSVAVVAALALEDKETV